MTTSSTTADQPRTPAGSPDGGKFAAKPGGAEADANLLSDGSPKQRDFHIVSRGGTTRTYRSSTVDEARAEHARLMEYDPAEAIMAVYVPDGPTADPHQPRILMDVSCQEWDGDQTVLDHVEHVDITNHVMTLSPRERIALLGGGSELGDEFVERARQEGRFAWDGPYEGHAAESVSDYVTDHRGRYWMSGWDSSGSMVRHARADTSVRLMILAGYGTKMTDDDLTAIGDAYRASDIEAVVEAETAAHNAIMEHGVHKRAISRLWNDANEHVSGNAHRADGGDEHCGNALGNAALAIYARQFMRDDRYENSDARAVTKAGYNAGTSTGFTLAHYDTLVAPVRDRLGSITDLDHSQRARNAVAAASTGEK